VKEPIPLTPALAAKSDVTYDKLIDEALLFLSRCGALSMKEKANIHHENPPAVSANECLGMATRIVAEAALQIQVFADEEEYKKALRDWSLICTTNAQH
jgi:hypothetical protein